MVYYEFVSARTPALFVATAHPDPADIPGAALQCCGRWEYVRPFRVGDGTHSPAVDATIRVRVAAEGYHIYLKRPAS